MRDILRVYDMWEWSGNRNVGGVHGRRHWRIYRQDDTHLLFNFIALAYLHYNRSMVQSLASCHRFAIVQSLIISSYSHRILLYNWYSGRLRQLHLPRNNIGVEFSHTDLMTTKTNQLIPVSPPKNILLSQPYIFDMRRYYSTWLYLVIRNFPLPTPGVSRKFAGTIYSIREDVGPWWHCFDKNSMSRDSCMLVCRWRRLADEWKGGRGERWVNMMHAVVRLDAWCDDDWNGDRNKAYFIDEAWDIPQLWHAFDEALAYNIPWMKYTVSMIFWLRIRGREYEQISQKVESGRTQALDRFGTDKQS